MRMRKRAAGGLVATPRGEGPGGDGAAKTVVITGGTRGIGLGMAEEFLRRGHNVAVCSRGAGGVREAVAALGAEHGPGRVLGMPCDVGDYARVRELWDAAVGRFGAVDVWINNAGVSHPRRPFWELTPGQVEGVVRANLLGVANGSKVAMEGMLGQGYGLVCNMEGLGSEGRVLRGLAPYGATKAAVTQLTRGLAADAKGTPVRVCFLRPGMVLTDILGAGTAPASAPAGNASGVGAALERRVVGVLADPVETAAPFLVGRILSGPRHGARIDRLPRRRMAWRLATAPFRRRDPSGG